MARQQKPSIRQKKFVKAYVENLASKKPLSTGQILKSVGYGTGLQNSPKRVLESDGVQSLLKRYSSSKVDDVLFTRHMQLLNKKEVIAARDPVTGEITFVKSKEIDVTAVSKGLDLMYRVRGMYPKETNNNTIVPVQINVNKSREEFK